MVFGRRAFAVADCDVLVAIKVNIGDHHGTRTDSGCEVKSLKDSTAAAPQNGDRVRGVIGRDQVSESILVELTGGEACGPGADRECAKWREPSLPVPAQDAHGGSG